LKDDLLGLKSKLADLELAFDTTGTETTLKEEKIVPVKVYQNSEEKMSDLLNKEKFIKLNIGGKIFKTNTATLKNFPESLFSKELENNQGAKELFFDRTFYNFGLILSFLREKKISFKKLSKYDKEDLERELEFYQLTQYVDISKKRQIDVNWDMVNSKAGNCSLENEDQKILRVNSTTCYCHFVVNKTFNDENFEIEFDANVAQTDNLFYFGIVNENYSLTGNCMCCTPTGAYYIQCNGNVKNSGTTVPNNLFNWGSQKTTIGLRVNLQEKTIIYYIPEKGETEPYPIVGNSWRVVSGHCNTGNGTITINSCVEI